MLFENICNLGGKTMNKGNITGENNKIIFTFSNGDEINYLELNDNKINESNINIL